MIYAKYFFFFGSGYISCQYVLQGRDLPGDVAGTGELVGGVGVDLVLGSCLLSFFFLHSVYLLLLVGLFH